MAAPSIDDSMTRRSELPMVVPSHVRTVAPRTCRIVGQVRAIGGETFGF